ncbi:hypothetical protein [Prosthecochloris sp. GSB1]|uniref:hypothetical protein n=1 Tax=Prosthecochloris sp. GSB1 TaxID=281093 RepID=UPI0012375ADE|nr:hypothetical protein [Prosthecochloris sp. GSB1]
MIFEHETVVGGVKAFHQKWYDGVITADSFIFSCADIGEMSESELDRLVRSSPMVPESSEIAVKKSDGFCFVDFNRKKV